MLHRVSFTCHACGWDSAGDRPELHQPGWARLSAYGGRVRWLAQSPASDAHVPVLDRLPARGEERWLSVRLPFRAVTGEPFHCLYQPPLSHFNGWTEHPEEIGRSAIVCCTLIDVVRSRKDAANVQVAVGDVWAVGETCSLFPAGHHVGASFWEGFATQTMHAVRWNQFICVHGSFEGDVATLALFEKRGDRHHLLLEGYDSYHADFVFIGNSPLDPEGETALDRVLRRLGLPPG